MRFQVIDLVKQTVVLGVSGHAKLGLFCPQKSNNLSFVWFQTSISFKLLIYIQQMTLVIFVKFILPNPTRSEPSF